MKRFILFTATLLFLLVAYPLHTARSQEYSATELWNNPMGCVDVAVSKDGRYVAAVNYTTLCFFSTASPVPLWWYLNNTDSENFLSVAISATGDYVIVGNNTGSGSIYYFGNSTTRTGLQASGSYNWTSIHFYDNGYGTDVERGTIDISDNGNYVAVGGTGNEVYYFADCTSKSGANRPFDWATGNPFHVLTLDMSPDGNYIAVGGLISLPWSGVAFYTNATTASHQQKWSINLFTYIFQVKVSDDGYTVAAVSAGGEDVHTLYYWANSTGLSGNPDATWTTMHAFDSVDMSSNGDNVVAGFSTLNFASLHFWNDSRTRTGANETETWIDLQTLEVEDVAISGDGSIIAATTPGSGTPQVYFFTSAHDLIASFNLTSPDYFLSMSGSGGIVAVAGGIELVDSLTLFSLTGAAPMPVGGFDVSPDYVMVLLKLIGPWILLAATCGAVLAVFVKKVRKHSQA
jgi:hypothetical protein